MIASSSSVGAAAPGAANPLLSEWNTPFGVPPFNLVRTEHYEPAFEVAMAKQRQEVDEIANRKEKPTFANTVEALEHSGLLLERCSAVFEGLVGADTTDELQAIAQRLAPKVSAHNDAITLNKDLFARIKTVWDARESLKLGTEEATLLERTWKRFVRGGALLNDKQQERMRQINADLATMNVVFSDNVLNAVNRYKLVIDKKEDLAGLPESVIAAAAETAKESGLNGKWVFTLHFPSIWPFLENADNRELRQQIFTAYISRCNDDSKAGNLGIAARSAALRTEKARMLGYSTWADFVLDEQMAKSPENVYDLLNRLWEPAKSMASREADVLRAAVKADGKDFDLQPWDWFYYTEKVRRAKYELNDDELRPYFQLEKVRDGAFEVARRLYGLTFKEIADIPAYNPELKAYEVTDADGSHLAVFYTDFHPRAGKRPGAWADNFRGTWFENGKSVRPVVINVCNFSKPIGGKPALLSLEEVETLFHEFGHGLHAILSRVKYRSLGSTPRDFVELPSQIMENWSLHPDVLKLYARHYKTGELIPASLVEKIQKTKLFNEGFRSVEYLAASLLDMEWHTLASVTEPEAKTFERVALARMGMPSTIVPRYHTSYFQHIFSNGYSAGYYSYIWAEVLDKDAFGAFEENGIFDPATARSFRVNILEKGRSQDPAELYRQFRGRDPKVDYLLKRRGFVTAGAGAGETVSGGK